MLHTRALRETSLLVDVLTPDHGVSRLVARGARGSKSRIRPLAQPFRPLLVSWSGAHELKTLTGLEEQGRSYALEKISLACAYYLNELLLRLLPEGQPCATVFARYAESLSELATSDNTVTIIESVLRRFELELLNNLGALPDFADCARTLSNSDAAGINDSERSTAIMAEADYDFFPEQGYAINVSRHKDAVDPVASNAMHSGGYQSPVVRVKGSTLLALSEVQFTDNSLREAKLVMRSLLALHLGTKPLKTREMIAFYMNEEK